MILRNIIKKVIAVLVVVLMMINSSMLLVISTAIDEVGKIIDKTKVQAVVEIGVEKYVNYQIDEDTKGVLLQTNVKTGIEYGEGQEYQRVNASGILLNMPKINEEYPEKIEVIGISTKATNGGEEAKDYQQLYEKETGELKIVALNKEDEEGNVYSEKVENARDEYTVIAYYGSNCYTETNEDRKLNLTGEVKLNIADEENTDIIKEINENYEVNENISGLVSTRVETSDIYNGYIESNIQNDTAYRTEYTENIGIDISYKEISDEIVISTKDNFVKNGEKKETEEIVYKSSKINKQEVLDKLGEEGSLKILNENGEALLEIDKDTETKEDGTVEIEYSNEIRNIIISTSKPINAGIITIESTKQIKESMKNIANTKISTDYNVQAINNIEIKDEETNEVREIQKSKVYEYTSEKETEIKSSETKVDVSIDKTEWTNNVQNEVNITATLVTNGNEYDLFENPIIELKLPNEVEKVVLGNVSLLYEKNLTIAKSEVIEKDGNKIIRIELEGTQTEYNLNSMVKGTNIIIPATIVLKKDISSIDTSINVSYTNEKANMIDYQREGKETKNIDIKVLNEVSQDVNIQGESTEDILKIESVANYSNELLGSQEIPTYDEVKNGLDIKIVAKAGNENLENSDRVNEKEVIKYEIKISNNLQKEISGISIQGQVPEGTNYATVDRGSYYNEKYDYIEDENKRDISIDNITIPANSEIIQFYEVVVQSLDAEVEEKNIENTIVVNYNNQEINTTKISNVIKRAEISLDFESYIGRDQENSFFYDLYVTNLTDHELKNIKIETTEFQKEMIFDLNNVLKNADDIKFDDRKLTLTIPSLEAKATHDVHFTVVAGNFDDGINECEIKIGAKAYTESGNEYRSCENIRTSYPCYVTVTKSSDKEGEDLKYDEEITYTISVKNEGKVKILVNVTDYLAEELVGIDATYERYVIENVEDYNITYDIEAEQNLKFSKEKQTIDLSYDIEGKADIDITELIPAGKTLEITVKAKADEVVYKTEILNYATVSGNNIKTTLSNTVKNNIMPEDTDINDNEDNGDNENNKDNEDNNDEKLYSLNGYVWIDKNKNGRKEEEEELLPNVTVKLFNADTNSIVVSPAEKVQKVYTDENGRYKFTDIKNGKYIVLFEYDTEKYRLTSYKEKNVSESLNSDVIDKEVNIDGTIKKVGLTDTININSLNVENISMGLIKKEEFDLKISKYISKVTVINGEGTKEYTYNNNQLAKVEISKKQIQNTTIKVEYKIVVSNENSLEGYVNEIIDYKPQELQFSSSENNGWIIAQDGKIKNTTLSGVKLAKGESKELTLVLTKELTDDSFGNVSNSAEISMYKNLEDAEDVNIENNKSEADLIISIKTGLDNKLIIMIIGTIFVLSVLAYCIKKKKIVKLMSIMFVLAISFVTISYSGFYNNDARYEWRIKLGKDANGNWIYIGTDNAGNNREFNCMDSGFPLCSSKDHYYKEYDTVQTVINTTQVKNSIKIEKNTNKTLTTEEKDDRLICGPYSVNIDVPQKASYEFTIIYNNNTKVTIDSQDKNNDSKDIKILQFNKGEMPKQYIHQPNTKEFTFFLSLSKDVKIINKVSIKFTINDVETQQTKYLETKYYYCVGTEDPEDKHTARSGAGCHYADVEYCNSNGLELRWYKKDDKYQEKACQRMKFLTPDEKTGSETENITKTISWAKNIARNDNNNKI